MFSLLLFSAQGEVLKGNLTLEHGTQQYVYAVHQEFSFSKGDSIELSEDALAKLVLDDGSVLFLSDGAQWEYTSDGYPLLSAGLAKVLKTSPAHKFYTVTTVIGVRGTSYEVAVGADGSTAITVENGTVYARPVAGDEEVVLQAGDGAELLIEDPVRFRRFRAREKQLRRWLLKRREWFRRHPDVALKMMVAYQEMVIKRAGAGRGLPAAPVYRAFLLHRKWVERRMYRYIKKHPGALKYWKRLKEKEKRLKKLRGAGFRRRTPDHGAPPGKPAPKRPRR